MFTVRKIVSLVLVISVLLMGAPGLAFGAESPTDLGSFTLSDGSNQYPGVFGDPNTTA